MLKAFCCAGPQPLPAHALGHGLSVHGHAFGLQLLAKARRAVAAFLRLKDLDDLRIPLGPLGEAFRGALPTAPRGIIATAREAEHRALSRDAVDRSMLVDGGVPQSSFFAKYAAVFPRISTSSLFSAS